MDAGAAGPLAEKVLGCVGLHEPAPRAPDAGQAGSAGPALLLPSGPARARRLCLGERRAARDPSPAGRPGLWRCWDGEAGPGGGGGSLSSKERPCLHQSAVRIPRELHRQDRREGDLPS